MSSKSEFKYSFIIPTLNEEKLLEKLLQSLSQSNLKQKYNYEIIVSDGGSKDATVLIAEKYADKVISHNEERRQLIAEGRNNGAKSAKGEILIFINADVRIGNVSEFFEILKNKFILNKFIAATFSVKVFPEEEILSDKLFLGFYNRYFHLLNIIGLGMGRGECQILSKETFINVNGYDEKKVAGEDFDLFMRLRKKRKILFIHNFSIFESPRRYRKYGHTKIFFTWLLNAVSVIFRNKSFSNQWEDIR